VHPIVEEAERASLTREVSRDGEGGWGSQSGVSMTSSNAIPIGIPRFYLHGRESGVSVSSQYSGFGVDDSPPRKEEPLRSFKQRMQQQDANIGHENISTQQQKAAERQEARGMNDCFPPGDAPGSSTERGESPSEANIPVRQASLGKRSKPTLTTVKSGDRIRARSSASNDALAGLPSQQKRAAEKGDTVELSRRQPEGDASSGADRAARLTTIADQSPTVLAPPPVHAIGMTSSNASFLDSSSEETNSTRPSASQDSPKPSIRVVNKSNENLDTPKPTHQPRGRSPLAKTDNDDYDARSKEMMLEDPEKDGKFGLLREDSDTLKSPTNGFSGLRTGRRKPARLDVDKIRDEEARGSLSSLSDLIKRATKLASNLDRGRTASRLGMEGWLGPGHANNNSSGELEKYRRSAGGSISSMLASFPPPGVPTPTGHEHQGSLANWSSRRSSAPLPSDSDSGSHTRNRKGRRCCGIPLWLFVTLLLLLLGLIAAATIIPVVLIVLPNQTNTSSPTAQSDVVGNQAATLNKCAAKLTCENGGQAFPTSGSDGETCRCLCVNSFTGPTCSSQSTAGCSSIAVPGMQENATVGNAIPRLLSLAGTDYDLQLDTQTLLGLFNGADLNCAAENALVSFDGKAQKYRRAPAPQATQTQASSSRTLSDQPAAATSNGIVFDSSPSPSQSSASTAPSLTSSSSSSPSSSASSSKTVDVDFARAAVLYILQSSSSLQNAESAQKALQENLDGAKGGVVKVGEWNVDLDGRKVTKV
jgi:hypothetical protein